MKKKIIILTIIACLSHLPVSAQKFGTNLPETTPVTRFTFNNDGTVTDKQTGLMWKVFSEGQLWNSAHQQGPESAIRYTWQQALQRARDVNNFGGFAGHTDWRVPNIKELLSIVERQCTEPAINLSIFFNTPSFDYYWTSSPSINKNNNRVWVVYFGDGHSYSSSKNASNYLRLVRDAQ